MKIYGVFDTSRYGYKPFVQEVEAVAPKKGVTYRIVSRDAGCFNFHRTVAAKDVSLMAEDAENKWRSALLERADKLEATAKELRERAKLKLEVIPA